MYFKRYYYYHYQHTHTHTSYILLTNLLTHSIRGTPQQIDITDNTPAPNGTMMHLQQGNTNAATTQPKNHPDVSCQGLSTSFTPVDQPDNCNQVERSEKQHQPQMESKMHFHPLEDAQEGVVDVLNGNGLWRRSVFVPKQNGEGYNLRNADDGPCQKGNGKEWETASFKIMHCHLLVKDNITSIPYCLPESYYSQKGLANMFKTTENLADLVVC